MAKQAKLHTSECGDMNFIPGIYKALWKERANYYNLSSNLHMHTSI